MEFVAIFHQYVRKKCPVCSLSTVTVVPPLTGLCASLLVSRKMVFIRLFEVHYNQNDDILINSLLKVKVFYNKSPPLGAVSASKAALNNLLQLFPNHSLIFLSHEFCLLPMDVFPLICHCIIPVAFDIFPLMTVSCIAIFLF